jgi:hypothetical protein
VCRPAVGRTATPANRQHGLPTSRSMQSWKLRRRRSGRWSGNYRRSAACPEIRGFPQNAVGIP